MLARVMVTPVSGASTAFELVRALESLRQRDREVRLHEQAHLLAAGPYAKGAPSYTYHLITAAVPCSGGC
jgi:hypothetical protein